MDADQVTRVLEHLGSHRIHPVGGANVMGTCPFPWNHSNGDSLPSFSVSIVSGGPSLYHCFGCRSGGRFRDAVNLWIIRSRYPSGWEKLLAWIDQVEAVNPVALVSEAVSGGLAKARGGGPPGPRAARALPVYPESSLDKFRPGLHPYLAARGVPAWLASAYGVCWDVGPPERVVFPVRTAAGELVGAQGRPPVDDAALASGAHGPKYYNYLRFSRSGVLYGEHVLARAARRGPVAAGLGEGVFDALAVTRALWRRGIYGLATFGAELSPIQAEVLVQLVSRVYLFRDVDSAGVAWRDAAVSLLRGRVQLWDVPNNFGKKDPGALSSGELRCALGGALPAAPVQHRTQANKSRRKTK